MRLEFFPESHILLSPAIPVKAFGRDLRHLGHTMLKVMIDNDGVGLAGPQVGISQRIFVFQTDQKIISWSGIKPVHEIVVNPKIIEYSSETLDWEEGCLSIPGVAGVVTRSKTIKTTYFNPLGVQKTRVFKGMQARIFQHEYDHLDGILFPQRIHKDTTGQWLDLKPYSRTELQRLDFINESRKGKTKNRPTLGLHQQQQ